MKRKTPPIQVTPFRVGMATEGKDSPRVGCNGRCGAGLPSKIETQEAPQAKEGKT